MAKNKSNKASTVVKVALGVLLIVAASVGGTLFYYNKMGSSSATTANDITSQPPVVLSAPIFSPLEPFTVTLNDEAGGRVLYVAITLRVINEASHKIIQEYMPEVRDRVLRELATQNPEQVQTIAGREALVNKLTTILQQPYLPHTTGPQINSVLFTAFVVQ